MEQHTGNEEATMDDLLGAFAFAALIFGQFATVVAVRAKLLGARTCEAKG